MPSIPLDRFKQAAVDRLNKHIGRLSLVDYEDARNGITGAADEETVRVVLRDTTGEEIHL